MCIGKLTNPDRFIQILHRRNHWIVISNVVGIELAAGCDPATKCFEHEEMERCIGGDRKASGGVTGPVGPV